MDGAARLSEGCFSGMVVPSMLGCVGSRGITSRIGRRRARVGPWQSTAGSRGYPLPSQGHGESWVGPCVMCGLLSSRQGGIWSGGHCRAATLASACPIVLRVPVGRLSPDCWCIAVGHSGTLMGDIASPRGVSLCSGRGLHSVGTRLKEFRGENRVAMEAFQFPQ
jgi:hypothetical protein